MSKKVKEALFHLYVWYDVNKPNNVSPQRENQANASLVDEGDEEGLEFLTFQFNKHMESEDSMGSKSEVERYLGESLEVDEKDKEFSVLVWWKNNGYKYPSLCCVARDIFAVPVSTVASESAFSTGGRVLDPFRSSLLPSTVEALICTQNWIRKSSTPINLRDALDEVEQLEKIESGNISFLIYFCYIIILTFLLVYMSIYNIYLF